jgi:hypothetical protein
MLSLCHQHGIQYRGEVVVQVVEVCIPAGAAVGLCVAHGYSVYTVLGTTETPGHWKVRQHIHTYTRVYTQATETQENKQLNSNKIAAASRNPNVEVSEKRV